MKKCGSLPFLSVLQIKYVSETLIYKITATRREAELP